MNKLFTLFFFLSITSFAFNQEICDNGIDDDGDGLIDLNDEECNCDGWGLSLFPNPSFEDTVCCPTFPGELSCAEEWIQASIPTTDYFNECGMMTRYGTSPPMLPIPGGGSGFVGFWNYEGWQEYVGACLTEPLIAGVEYTLNIWTAWGNGPSTLDLTIYGTPNCVDLPWTGYECPVGFGAWEYLANQTVTLTTDGAWQEVTLTFTPTIDMYAVAIGGPCDDVPPSYTDNYFYLDELTLLQSSVFANIEKTGNWCDGDAQIEVSIDTLGGTWQWFLEGIALDGETEVTISANDYGFGLYSAVYTIGENCRKVNYLFESPGVITTNFSFEDVCFGESVNFINSAITDADSTINHFWDFGDDNTSTADNPTHIYSEAGEYTVELISSSEDACNDTIAYLVTVYEVPTPQIEFIAGGVSSLDGAIGACISQPILLNDLSTISAPGTIISWSWDFGDGNTSTEQNPNHTYLSSGSYTITLTVTSEDGCEATTTTEIIMTNSISLDIIYNNPTCFNFTDGSITVGVDNAIGEVIYSISNDLGEVLNIENSNTANTLGAGWYYINVTDESVCDGIDSILLTEPGQLDIDLIVNEPLCYGGSDGWAHVNEVTNYEGDYAAINYNWNPNPAGNNGLLADSTWNLSAGQYTLTLNDQKGCTRTFDFEINQPDSLYFNQLDYDPAYCRIGAYQNGNGVAYASVIGGTPSINYLWTNLSNGVNETSSTWGGLNPGAYQIVATDANGCELLGTIQLDSLNPIADFDLTSGGFTSNYEGTAALNVHYTNTSINYSNPNSPSGEPTFFWNLDTLNAAWFLTHDVLDEFDTIYQPRGKSYDVDVCLVAINKNGCKDTTCKLINIYEPIQIEDINIFTPNGDGINDIFTFEFKAKSIATFQCTIVNRWGIVMAELQTITAGWDGTDMNGSPCKDGVYFYTYQAKADDGTDLSGQGTIQINGTGY
jgi:gliding motility-associated-like protein